MVYVDNDPMVMAHSRALKTGGNTVVIEADLRKPQMILDHPDTRKLIDLNLPFAVLMVAVLHFIGDEDQPHAIVSAIRDALPAGSYLVLSHVTGDIRPEVAARSEAEYKKVTPGATLRTQEEILRFFTGLELLDPGLVQVPTGVPRSPSPQMLTRCGFGGVGATRRAQARPGRNRKESAVTGACPPCGHRAAKDRTRRTAFRPWRRFVSFPIAGEVPGCPAGPSGQPPVVVGWPVSSGGAVDAQLRI